MFSESIYCEKMLNTLIKPLKKGRSKCSRSCFCNALILGGDQGNWGGLRKSTDSPERSHGLRAPHHVLGLEGSSVCFNTTDTILSWTVLPNFFLPLCSRQAELLNLTFQTHPQRNRGIFYTLFSPNLILVFALTLEPGADVPCVCLSS